LETLIIFILIGLLSAFFNKEKKKTDTSMPPFNPNEKPKVEDKSLDDYAKKVYKQLKEKKEAIFEERNVDEQKEVNPVYIQREQRVQRPSIEQSMKKVELSQKPIEIKQQRTERKQLELLSSKKTIVNAIIAQEILGPPKAKRR